MQCANDAHGHQEHPGDRGKGRRAGTTGEEPRPIHLRSRAHQESARATAPGKSRTTRLVEAIL